MDANKKLKGCCLVEEILLGLTIFERISQRYGRPTTAVDGTNESRLLFHCSGNTDFLKVEALSWIALFNSLDASIRALSPKPCPFRIRSF